MLALFRVEVLLERDEEASRGTIWYGLALALVPCRRFVTHELLLLGGGDTIHLSAQIGLLLLTDEQ